MVTPPKKLAKKTVSEKPDKLPVTEATTTVSEKPEFKIESGIPVPPRTGANGGRSGSKYPIRQLDIDQSVFIESKPSKVASAIQAAKKAEPNRTYTGRAVSENGKDGVRVWRTA